MLRPDPDEPAEALRDQLTAWLARSGDVESLVVSTSGSTARPKRVVHSRESVLASADATHCRLGGPGAWLLTLPHAYVAGVQVLVRSLRAGHAPVVRTAGEPLAEAIARLDAPRRYASLVPTQLHRLLEAGADDGRGDLAALASLDCVLLGGGPVAAEMRARAAAHGVTTVATYGMAETAGGCVYDGLPLDGVAMRIDEDARILVRGPMLFDRYEDDEPATRESFVDGWFRTADVGEIVHDAGTPTLRVLGRADDVVVSGGVNVPGSVVAARLRTHRGVAAVEVIGVEDPEWGHRLVAYVVLSDGTPDPSATELRDWVTAAHPRSWAPREVVVVPSIPRTDRGKIDRGALHALVETGKH